ncbi:MAG: type II toxin-antitoxin system RelE/ParE family toxin [Deltaproteobacteria bacterium]|nr:type II toxin-antitoxin system RelE/ParE family toxin [Deltaproteobacteria bacterium]
MKIFVTKNFDKWASRQKLADVEIVFATQEMEDGLIDASLGGNVYKKRIGLHGQGKSSGVRTLVAYKKSDKIFFVYGFHKNQRVNISNKETLVLKEQAKLLFALSNTQLDAATETGALREVAGTGENHE